jgi:hypothetical protein
MQSTLIAGEYVHVDSLPLQPKKKSSVSLRPWVRKICPFPPYVPMLLTYLILFCIACYEVQQHIIISGSDR